MHWLRPAVIVCHFAFGCMIATPTFSDTRIVSLDEKGRYAKVEINGPISWADAERFKKIVSLIRPSFEVISVELNSPGGDVMAALAVGDLIRAEWMWTVARDEPGSQCASACVLVLAAGAQRIASDNSNVAIHRPRFDTKMFAGLGRDDARKKYEELSRGVAAYLSRMGMSPELFAIMMRVPSSKVRRLEYSDMEKFGLVGSDPGYDEWVRAKSVARYGEKMMRVFDAYMERARVYLRNCLAGGRDEIECAVESDRVHPNPLKEALDTSGLEPVSRDTTKLVPLDTGGLEPAGNPFDQFGDDTFGAGSLPFEDGDESQFMERPTRQR